VILCKTDAERIYGFVNASQAADCSSLHSPFFNNATRQITVGGVV